MSHGGPDPMPMPMPPPDGGTHADFTYRDLDVVVHDPGPGADPMLMIGGREVMVRREEAGGYSAPMFNMFGSHPTMAELARELVDISPVFIAQRYGRGETPPKPKRAKKGK